MTTTPTPALSIRQPWAWLLAHADAYPNPKRIENRNWRTSRRGLILLHASRTFDQASYDAIVARRPDLRAVMPAPGQYELGGIIGQAELVDCIQSSDDEWFFGPNGLVLARARPRPFVPVKGKLGFFPVLL